MSRAQNLRQGIKTSFGARPCKHLVSNKPMANVKSQELFTRQLRHRHKKSVKMFPFGVSRMGLGSFVDINIFDMKYYFILFLHILHFFESLKS